MGNYVDSIGVAFPRPPFFKVIKQFDELILGDDQFRIGVSDAGLFIVDEMYLTNWSNCYSAKKS